MVRVAVIDDGIKLGVYGIHNLSHDIVINSDLVLQEVDECNLSKVSHGTTCAGIVKKYYPEVILSSVKVLNNGSHKGKKEQLVRAIEWCMDNGIQVANLSLGTIDYRDFDLLRDVINRAYNKGLVIVAACNNKDIFTCPASYNNVIGVKCCKTSNLKEGEYIFNLYPIDGIEITSCSEHTLLKNEFETKTTSWCNSYAAPMITAEVCKIINAFPHANLEEIKEDLYRGSINYSDNIIRIINYKSVDWITKAAVLDIDGENYDFKLSYTNNSGVFKRVEDIDDNQFDTLILLNSISKDYKKINSVVSQFEKQQKNIVVMDDGKEEARCEVKYQNSNIKFWSPSIVRCFYEGCLPQRKIDVPLVIVYDYTDSKMIKILEKLNAKFRSDGYYAGGICVKSIGILCGLEYIPVSKNDEIKQVKDKIEVLYNVYDYDIIFLGLNIDKEDTYTIKEINMYLKPDISIFIVDDFAQEIEKCTKEMNPNETLIITAQEYIERYLYLGCKIFNHKEYDLFYKEILSMLI